MKIIEVTNLVKKYQHIQEEILVLNNIHLLVEKSESLAIMGRSGRGKTSLLYLLSGLDRPTEGEIRINNQRIDTMGEVELSKFRAKNFGFIFQHHFLLNDLTALENALLPLRILNKLSNKTIKDTKEYFEYLGITNRLDHIPQELSGGECQRVAVIRSLVHNPLIIFADEPTGSLDCENSRNLERLLFNLVNEKKITLLISTHNQDIADQCQKITTIDNLEKEY